MTIFYELILQIRGRAIVALPLFVIRGGQYT